MGVLGLVGFTYDLAHRAVAPEPALCPPRAHARMQHTSSTNSGSPARAHLSRMASGTATPHAVVVDRKSIDEQDDKFEDELGDEI